MASSVIGALRVTLGLDSAEFEAGVRRSQKEAKGFENTTRTLSTAVRGLGAALGVVGIGAAARGFLSLSDQSANLAAQLKLATRESGSFAQAQEDVRRIAEATRSGLADTAALYGNFSRGTQELGLSQEAAARATETFSKTLKISGADANQAASATLQFGQALASGALRGDELNSVLEASPRLAKLLTDSMDAPLGAIKQMGEEGKLTSDKLLNALTNTEFTASIDDEFRELPVTFDDAMTQVHNAAVITFGGFDRGGEFSQALANFIMQGTDGFTDLENSAVNTGIEIRAAFEGLGDAFDPLWEGAKTVFGNINMEVASTRDQIAQLLGAFDELNTETATEHWINKNVWGLDTVSGTGSKERFLAGYDRTERSRRGALGEASLNDMLRGYDVMGNPTAKPRRSAPARSSGGSGGSGGAGSAAKKAEAAAKKAEREAEAARKKAEREAERAAEALRRFTDEVAGQQADLVSAWADLSRSAEKRAEAELAEIETQRQIQERAIRADNDINAAQQEQLLLLNDQNADVQARLVKQRLADDLAERNTRIEEDRHGLAIELLQYTGDLARTAKEARAVESRILDHAFDAEKARLEQIKATSAVTSAEYAYAEARLQALPQLKAGAVNSAERATMGPLESYLDKLPRSADEAREALERVQVDGINGIIDGLAAAATGAQSLGNVFKSVVNQIVADLIRIQLQKAIVGGLSNILGGGLFDGGAGLGSHTAGLGSGISSAVAGLGIPKFATGGSFKVGGPSSVGDKSLVMFRANAGEMVDIHKGDPGGRGITVHVNAQDAVLTHTVRQWVAEGVGVAIDGGANAGMQRMQYRNSRRVA